MTIQNIDMTEFYDVNIHCPFCGQKVLDYGIEDEQDMDINPCSHTLFVCSEEAWEYQSEEFKTNLGIEGVDLNNETPEDFEDLSVAEITEKVSLSDPIKITQIVGPPAMISGYIGFAPSHK